MPPAKPVSLFYSYSHKDEEYRDALETHLAMLRREGCISEWHDRRLVAGEEWDRGIGEHLESAGIILLLVSADFIASDYIWDVEVKRALELHKSGKARVIPVVLRVCDWNSAPFGRLQALPKDAKPIKSWTDHDAAFTDVARGIRKAIDELTRGSRPTRPRTQKPPEPEPTDQTQDSLESLLARVRVLESEVTALWVEVNNQTGEAMQRGELTVSQEGDQPRFHATGAAARTNWDELYARTRAEVEAKARQSLAILERAEDIAPESTDVLLHRGLALAVFKATAGKAREVLLKVVALIDRPKNDEEQAQLARTRLALAPIIGNPEAAETLVRDARRAYAELGEDGWVRTCDNALAFLQASTAFMPVGHWRIDVQTMGMTSVWDLVFAPNGSYQGMVQTMMGTMPAAGVWGYDPANRLLQFQAFDLVRIFITGRQGNGWTGTDHVASTFLLTRLP